MASDADHLREVESLRARVAELEAGRRLAAQTLIEIIGAPGPESIEETAARAMARLVLAERVIEELRPPRDLWLLDRVRALLVEWDAEGGET